MKKKIILWCLGVSVMGVCAFAESEETAADEEALDAKLGLTATPFDINVAALKTRTDLRKAAGVKTGLPGYDQQVETAQGAPASLLTQLMTPEPAPQRSRRRAGPVEDEPNCYYNQNQVLVCE